MLACVSVLPYFLRSHGSALYCSYQGFQHSPEPECLLLYIIMLSSIRPNETWDISATGDAGAQILYTERLNSAAPTTAHPLFR
jgi:hypothetical protein